MDPPATPPYESFAEYEGAGVLSISHRGKVLLTVHGGLKSSFEYSCMADYRGRLALLVGDIFLNTWVFLEGGYAME